MGLNAGDRVGTYEIIAPLGAGGMGEVYRARDTKLHRDVALKILPEPFRSDPDRRQRFEREAQAVAALNHPGIVTIYSVESAGDVLFLTMELVDGRLLSDAILPGGMALAELLRIMIPLADAVSAAHQRGITHRDLKPANVMIAADGRVKVLDFGLAKVDEQGALDAGSLPTQALTGEGKIVGTVAYMSPEQAEGKPVDQRTDIFSLGIILYELATGRRPFTGETSASIMAAIIKDSPASLTDVRSGLPSDLARIVKRSLVKDPEHRYQTAKDLRNELEALKDDVTSGVIATAPPAAPAAALRGGRALLMIVAASAAAAAVTVPIVLKLRHRQPDAPAAPTFDAVKLTRLTNAGTVTHAAISPDGKYVVHARGDVGQQGLWLRQVATSSNVEIVPASDVRYDGVAFSPDGNYIYFSAYAGTSGGNVAWLQQIPVLGGTPRRVLEDIDSPVTFAPDGKRFAYLKGFQAAGETAIMIANADGTGVKRLASRKAPDGFPLSNIAWSPDGKVIAAPANVTSDGQRSMRVVAVDAETGAQTPIGSKNWANVLSVAWLGPGGLVLAAAERGASPQLWYVPYPAGDARRITTDLNNYDQVSTTADGSALVTVQGDSQAHLWVGTAGDMARAAEITSGTGRFDVAASWTPDGRLVYSSNAGGTLDIWISDAGGGGAHQLTVDPGAEVTPSVTADGRTIVFQTSRGGGQISRMDIDGGNQTPLTKAGGATTLPLLSPDGRWVYYAAFDRERSVWKVPIDGGNPVRVFDTPVPAEDAARVTMRATFVPLAVSPDGKLFVGNFLDRSVRGFRAGLVSIETEALVKTFETAMAAPSFTPDGRGVLFLQARNGAVNVWNQPIDGGKATPVTNYPDGTIFSAAWSRDGKRLAFARGNFTDDAVMISNLAPAPAGRGTK